MHLPASHRFVQEKWSIQVLKLSQITAIIGWMNYHDLCSWFSLTIMQTCRSLYLSTSAIPLSPVWEFSCCSQQSQCGDFPVSSEETRELQHIHERRQDDGTITLLRFFKIHFLPFSPLHPLIPSLYTPERNGKVFCIHHSIWPLGRADVLWNHL